MVLIKQQCIYNTDQQSTPTSVPSVTSTLYFDDGCDRNGQERNRLFLTFNYQLTALDMKTEVKDRVMSHEKPVVAAVYNSIYNQVRSQVFRLAAL